MVCTRRHEGRKPNHCNPLAQIYKKTSAECSRIDLCINCLAVLPDRRAPTSLVHSGSNLGNGDNYLSRFDPDHLCRRLLWLFRQLLSSKFPWPSGSALCQDDIVEFSEPVRSIFRKNLLARNWASSQTARASFWMCDAEHGLRPNRLQGAVDCPAFRFTIALPLFFCGVLLGVDCIPPSDPAADDSGKQRINGD
jgi:hypothetical protein